MATKVYEENVIELIDGTEITVGPSKIKYLRGILDTFNKIDKDSTEVLDIINMDKVQLDKIMFIVDRLRDGK